MHCFCLNHVYKPTYGYCSLNNNFFFFFFDNYSLYNIVDTRFTIKIFLLATNYDNEKEAIIYLLWPKRNNNVNSTRSIKNYYYLPINFIVNLKFTHQFKYSHFVYLGKKFPMQCIIYSYLTFWQYFQNVIKFPIDKKKIHVLNKTIIF